MGRCRPGAALLYAWVHRRSSFVDVDARLAVLSPATLADAVAEACVGEDAFLALWERLGGADVPGGGDALSRLTAYLTAPAAAAGRLLPGLLAGLDALRPDTATYLFLGLLFRALALGEPVDEMARRFLGLFPDEGIPRTLAEEGLLPLVEAVRLLRRQNLDDAARRVLEMGLLAPHPEEEERRLLEEGLALYEGRPVRRRLLLERLVLLGDEARLEDWLDLVAEAEERLAFARRLTAAGRRSAAVRLLARMGRAEEALAAADPSLSPEALLALWEALPPARRVSLLPWLREASERASGATAARLRRAARSAARRSSKRPAPG
jgi:hypothetical protein